MFDTWFTIVLVGILVQLDILLAARGFSKVYATHYDLAAVPSKGVYLVLAAVSIVIFPYARARAQPNVMVMAAMMTMGLGFVLTGALVLFRGFVGEVLGQDVASILLLLSLGAAMSFAGATGVIANCSVALGVARPWPPLLMGLMGLFFCWLAKPSVTVFALVVLGIQALTMLMSLWVCLRGARGDVSADASLGISRPKKVLGTRFLASD